MTPKTQQPLHPYSVKIETPTGKSATLPVTLLTPRQAEQVSLSSSDWRTKRGSKAHASMCNGSLPMTMRRSSVRRRRACELPCQRRHDWDHWMNWNCERLRAIGAVFGFEWLYSETASQQRQGG